MSQFTIGDLACPACGAAIAFDLVHSVNADRAPGLRRAILDGSFQRTTCPTCGSDFRIEPDFNYVEHGRDLWVAVLPIERLARWREDEADAEARFERIYGPRSSPLIQSIGKCLRRRLAFGWAAIREKLVIDDLGLDDVTVELCKSAVLRASTSAPVGLGAELRLLGGDDSRLHLAWMRSENESVAEAIGVGRELYAEIAADENGDWQSLRAQIGEGMFVDLGRLLIPAPPAALAAEAG